MNGLSLKTVTDIVHNAVYVHWMPSEGWYRRCSFPFTMRQVDGIPPVALLDDNLQAIDQQAIENYEHRDGLD